MTRVSRWSRYNIVVSSGFLLLWQISVLFDLSGEFTSLAILGFVLHTVFGMSYILVPGYFGNVLSTEILPGAQLLLTAVGALLVAYREPVREVGVDKALGSTLWVLGIAVFVAILVLSVRNQTPRETKWMERYVRYFVFIPFLYLIAGSYGILSVYTNFPLLLDAYIPRYLHLIATGCPALLIYVLGFQLLSRFLDVELVRGVVIVVLISGILAPPLVSLGLPSGDAFLLGGLLEATAMAGFSLTAVWMYLRSDRKRVGVDGIVLGSIFGTLGVFLGVLFAVEPMDVLDIHSRVNTLGFFGLTIIGFAYLFHVPESKWKVGIKLTIYTITFGLLVELLGYLITSRQNELRLIGEVIELVGVLGYVSIICLVLLEIGRR